MKEKPLHIYLKSGTEANGVHKNGAPEFNIIFNSWARGKGTCHQVRVLSVGLTWWKERTNSYKLSSDLHMCTLAHITYTINKRESDGGRPEEMDDPLSSH